MKKRFLLLPLLLLLALLVALSVAPAAAEDDIRLYVDGQRVGLEVPPLLIDGTTLLPLRAVGAALGAEAAWDAESRTATLTKDGRSVRVIDGDTLEVDINGVTEKVRLIGIDTPESVHPNADRNNAYGEIAAAYTGEQLTGRQVGLEFDVSERDQYGRLLAYVYVDGKMFNKTLLELGYAVVSTWPPNVKYVDDFTAIQQAARAAGAGFWADYLPPKTSGTYVGSAQSDKYHAPGCRYAEKILPEHQIWFDTREEATALGYSPCAVCRP